MSLILHKKGSFGLLPTQLIGRVLVLLERCEVLLAARVCKLWCGVCDRDFIWKNLYLRRWPPEAALSPRVCVLGPNSPWKQRMRANLWFETNWKAARHKRTLIDAHAEPIVRLACDYFVLVSATQREVKVWDAQSLRCIFSVWWPDIPSNITSLQVRNGRLAYGMANGTISVWDYTKKACVRQFRHHSGTITCMVLDAPVATYVHGADNVTPLAIFSGSTDGSAILTDLQRDDDSLSHGAVTVTATDWTQRDTLDAEKPRLVLKHSSALQSVDADCDRKQLITADSGGVRLWDSVSGACLCTLLRHGPKRVRFVQDTIVICVIRAGVFLVQLHVADEKALSSEPFQTLISAGGNFLSKPPLPDGDYRVTSVNDGTGDLGQISVWAVWPGQHRRKRPPLNISHSHHSCGSQNVERIVFRSFRSAGAFEVMDFTGSSHEDNEGSQATMKCTCVVL